MLNLISFNGENFTQGFSSMELAVIQDAEWLDDLAVQGFARAWVYGARKGMTMHDSSTKPVTDTIVERYKYSKAQTIYHFREQLRLLKERMNTETGRKMAEQQHRIMEQYQEQAFRGYEGR